MTRSPSDEINDLQEHSLFAVEHAMAQLATALAEQDNEAEREASNQLAQAVSESMAYADLVGRRRVLLEADAMRDDGSLELSSRVMFAEGQPNIFVPSVPFMEAVNRILRREPRLAETAASVAEHYRSGDGFAAAHAATVAVAKRVRDSIASFIRRGIPAPTAAAVIAETEDWSRAYSETVYRTNVSTAYSDGRREQVKDPDVRAVIGAFKISATRDRDVRRGRSQDHGENHLAADGLVAATNDPIWDRVRTPFGYNCRCVQIMVSRANLKRRGLLKSNGEVERYHPRGLGYFWERFRPHPNFAR